MQSTWFSNISWRKLSVQFTLCCNNIAGTVTLLILAHHFVDNYENGVIWPGLWQTQFIHVMLTMTNWFPWEHQCKLSSHLAHTHRPTTNKPRRRNRISDAISLRAGSPVASNARQVFSMTFSWLSEPCKVALNADNSFVLAWETAIDGKSRRSSSPISSSEYRNPASSSEEWIALKSLPYTLCRTRTGGKGWADPSSISEEGGGDKGNPLSGLDKGNPPSGLDQGSFPVGGKHTTTWLAALVCTVLTNIECHLLFF